MKRLLSYGAVVLSAAFIFTSCAKEDGFTSSNAPSKVVVMNGLTGSSAGSVDIFIGDDEVVSNLASLEYTTAFEVEPGTEELMIFVDDQLVATETMAAETQEEVMLVITTTVDGTILVIEENMPSEEDMAALTETLGETPTLVTIINASASSGSVTAQLELEGFGFATLGNLNLEGITFGEMVTIPMEEGSEEDQSIQFIETGTESITGSLLEASIAANESGINFEISQVFSLLLGTDEMNNLNIQSSSDFSLLVEGLDSYDVEGQIADLQSEAQASADEQMVALEQAVVDTQNSLTYTIILTGDGSGSDNFQITVIDQDLTGLVSQE